MSKTRCMGCMQEYDDGVNVCPYCGYVKGTPVKEKYHLIPGTVLKNRYLVGQSIGFGGFGITYIGWDKLLEKKVAIKEYLPSEFATRMEGTTVVSAYDGEKTRQYESGLTRFIDEAQRLAKLNHLDGIVHIFDSFSENCTAYIVMEYLSGETLKSILKTRDKLSYQEAIDIAIPLLNSLEEVHKKGIIHRDIAPDNIMITDDGRVKLIDFGAARYATTVHSKSLSVVLKPGYAPEEQYRSHGNQKSYPAALLCLKDCGKSPVILLHSLVFSLSPCLPPSTHYESRLAQLISVYPFMQAWLAHGCWPGLSSGIKIPPFLGINCSVRVRLRWKRLMEKTQLLKNTIYVKFMASCASLSFILPPQIILRPVLSHLSIDLHLLSNTCIF